MNNNASLDDKVLSLAYKIEKEIQTLLPMQAFARRFFANIALSPSEHWITTNLNVRPPERGAVIYCGDKEETLTSHIYFSVADLEEDNKYFFTHLTQKVVSDILCAEEELGVQELISAAKSRNKGTRLHFPQISHDVFNELINSLEIHKLPTSAFLINKKQLLLMEMHMSGSVDPVSQREWNLAGYVGKFRGYDIFTPSTPGAHNLVPENTIIAVSNPEFVGQFATRIEAMSVPFNGHQLAPNTQGLTFLEKVGFASRNPNAVAIATILK